MAIAVETSRNLETQNDYKVWYLEHDSMGNVVGLGVKTREEVLQSIFRSIRKTGHSNWRAFTKDSEESKPIEIYDFISRSMSENTHFGNLPTLCEFQETLDRLKMNFELRKSA